MSRIESRPYAGVADLDLLVDLARSVTAARWPRATYWHVGDIIWLLFAGTDFDPFENIRLWVDGQGLVGAAWFEPPDQVQLDVRPEMDVGIAAAMLAWGEKRRRAFGCRDAAEMTLSATALESHGERIAIVDGSGYVPSERFSSRMCRSLQTPIPDPGLPANMLLRHATDADIDERVSVHRDAWSVWGPSRVTGEAYRRLRAAPGYDAELDVVLETHDGTFASYCICWPDEANGVGLFEPVGTRPRFAGQGLGRAVVFEALRRLRDRGMHTAIVQTASINERALALYQSCGFEVVERERFYVKQLA